MNSNKDSKEILLTEKVDKENKVSWSDIGWQSTCKGCM